MNLFLAFLKEMITKPDDPGRIDWASVFVLSVYATLLVAVLAMIMTGFALGTAGPATILSLPL